MFDEKLFEWSVGEAERRPKVGGLLRGLPVFALVWQGRLSRGIFAAQMVTRLNRFVTGEGQFLYHYSPDLRSSM